MDESYVRVEGNTSTDRAKFFCCQIKTRLHDVNLAVRYQTPGHQTDQPRRHSPCTKAAADFKEVINRPYQKYLH